MGEWISDCELKRLCGFLSDATGLNFPAARWSEMRRGIIAAAKESGHASPIDCVRRAMNAPAPCRELQSLINNLTIGETYFFRDKPSFDLLANEILPPLIRERRKTSKQLRIWSAACCTGEEAYSIAIVLRQTIPDWRDWNLTVLATDINSHFLRKAISGVFGRWSFRNAPDWLQRQYFRLVAEGQFEITPELKQMVRFENLNLVGADNPSPQTNAHSMDVIFCRDVLMYFAEAQTREVLQRLYRAQADEGWLLVGPSELPHPTCRPYVAANFQGVIIYRKTGTSPELEPERDAVELSVPPPRTAAWPSPSTTDKTAKLPDSAIPDAPLGNPAAFNRAAVLLADQGKLSEALDYCNRSIAIDRLNAPSHYLQAVILQEQGEMDLAVRALQTALYVDPKFVPAHFVLGNIARRRGNTVDAARHLHNARMLLRRYRPQDMLPEFDGVPAGRLIQLIDSLSDEEAAI